MDFGIKFQDDQVTHHCNQAKKKKKEEEEEEETTEVLKCFSYHVAHLGKLRLGMCGGMLFVHKSFAGGCIYMGFPGGSVGKEPTYNAGDAGDVGSIPESGRTPGEGNSHPLQYSHLENPMDSGAWQATVHGVAKSWT